MTMKTEGTEMESAGTKCKLGIQSMFSRRLVGPNVRHAKYYKGAKEDVRRISWRSVCAFIPTSLFVEMNMKYQYIGADN